MVDRLSWSLEECSKNEDSTVVDCRTLQRLGRA